MLCSIEPLSEHFLFMFSLFRGYKDGDFKGEIQRVTSCTFTSQFSQTLTKLHLWENKNAYSMYIVVLQNLIILHNLHNLPKLNLYLQLQIKYTKNIPKPENFSSGNAFNIML